MLRTCNEIQPRSLPPTLSTGGHDTEINLLGIKTGAAIPMLKFDLKQKKFHSFPTRSCPPEKAFLLMSLPI